MTSMHSITAIHQFHPSCSVGDGVTNSLFFTRKLLRRLGFESEIFCEDIPAELKSEVRPLSGLPGEGYLLLQHHSLGYRNAGWLDTLPAARVLVYHNITPPHLLPEGDLADLSRLGRQQLREWAQACRGGIGVSAYNSTELADAGYRNLAVLPLLVDLEELRRKGWDRKASEQYRNCLNILFVGRINENKRQHELIEVFDEFEHFTDQPARLILAGGTTSGAYLERLQAMIDARGAQDRILLLGKVSDAVLQSLYRVADLFVCLSEHEGFCMPLLEAMAHDVPVVARDAGALASTLGSGGLLLEAGQSDPREIAAAWRTLLAEPGLRRRVIAGQRRNLEHYAPQRLAYELAEYLATLGCAIPNPVGAPDTGDLGAAPYWQVEGPIDSTYSLAIVNRELGMALARQDHDIGLFRPTGTDGGSLDPEWLDKHAPEAAPLARRAIAARQHGVMPAATLRFNYPPWVDGMEGEIRAVHSYGWEESAFPGEYVAAFNRGLDVVTTLSTEVAKILRDSGVSVPMAVVGTGVDHVLRDAPVPVDLPPEAARAAFRFLHVSSCFPRKGIDVLLAAYGKAFRAGQDVALIIKTFPNPHNDVARQLARLRQADPAYPPVVLIEDDLSQAQLVWLYRSCHALVAPSRGEGFGMPMAEAMLFGLPVIVTAWGGQTDFCTEATAWLCDYDFVPAQSHMGVPHSVWAEPRCDHLTALLKEVRNSAPDLVRQRTDAARQRVLRDYTWERVAQRTQAALAKVAALPLWRKQPKVGWITTWNTRCGIANYSRFLASVFPVDRLAVFAASALQLEARDEDYVVRCWSEDINRVDIDDILREVEAADIGAMVIQYNFGFFSLTALGRLIRRLRERNVPTYVFLHSTADIRRDDLHISLAQIVDDLRLAERLVVHGVVDVNRLKSFGLVGNVLMFPHGVQQTPPAPPESLRVQRGLQGKRVVASYGFMLPHKGAQELIRAFGRLAALDPALHLLLVCALYPADVSVQERDRCQDLINRLGLAQRVTMVNDFLPDAESLSWLQMADLIVYPYQFTQESSSAAVRGGLAAGRPVAVTPLSIFDDVADAVHKLPGTSDADLAAGIWSLISDGEALEALRRRGQDWCEPRSWPRVSQRLLNLIDGVANDL